MCASENVYESGGTSLEHLNSYPPSPALKKLSSVAKWEWPAHPERRRDIPTAAASLGHASCTGSCRQREC